MSGTRQQSQLGALKPFIIVGLASLFYVYEFYLRVMPSAMTDDLMRSFNTEAGVLLRLCTHANTRRFAL
jgi:hypothetical protein